MSNDWLSGVEGMLGGTGHTSSIPITPLSPTQPNGTLPSKVLEAEERFDKRLARLRELLPITEGRQIPDDDDLMIGDARRLRVAVLYLDICGFSKIDSEEKADQERVLTLLNLFMAEMIDVVYQHDGRFEKNTGDGLMAYFKESTEQNSVLQAVRAAVTMHNHNDRIISPRLRERGLPEIKFRVSVDFGWVTIANVGIRGGNGSHRSHVAIGNTANAACKAMSLIPDGGILVGDIARSHLPTEWQNQTRIIGDRVPGFFFRDSGQPYIAWELTYRAPTSSLYNFSALASLAGLGRPLNG